MSFSFCSTGQLTDVAAAVSIVAFFLTWGMNL